MQILTAASAWWSLACLVLGIGYATLLYRSTSAFTPAMRRLLFVFRALTVSLIAFLLLSPLIRTTTREKEKPIVVLAIDDSQSILLSDSSFASQSLPAIYSRLKDELSATYQVQDLAFSDRIAEGAPSGYTGKQTDYDRLIQEINARYTNRNLAAVIVASDGLYNKGGNPLYRPLDAAVPVYTIALGDTTVRKDLLIAKTDYNKVVYLGNSFPVEVTVDARQCNGSSFTLTVKQDSNTVFSRTLTAAGSRYRTKVPVVLEARKKGILKLQVSVSEVPGEVTTSNNSTDVYIEVRESKEKILLLANAPHPDIGAIKSQLEQSQNYTVTVRMVDQPFTLSDFNLVILHNLPSDRYSFEETYRRFHSSGVPMLIVIGTQTSLAALNKLDAGLEVIAGGAAKSNAVQASLDPGFSLFRVDDIIKVRITAFPPLFAPFGDYKPSGTPSVLLYQQIGNVRSDEPLLFFTEKDRVRCGFIAGEGMWRWPVAEYAAHREVTASREILVKTIQFLSVKEERSRFRVELKRAFQENEPILIDAEVFNENYEPVQTAEVTVDITNENGKRFPFSCSPSGSLYSLNAGYLAPGQYKYTAKATMSGESLVQSGTFTVAPVSAELSETVADHRLLEAWSEKYNGRMFLPGATDELVKTLLSDDQAKTVSYSRTELKDLINIKELFFLLLLFLAAEWLLRKRSGSY